MAAIFVLVVASFAYGFISHSRRVFPYKGVEFWSNAWSQGLSSLKGPGKAPKDAPLNVIVFVMDACRADGLSVYGNPRRTSPYMDALAAHAAVFDRAFSQAPWTPASMASIFTGTYQSVHQLITHPEDIARREFGVLSPELETMAEMFRSRGFRTAAVSSQPWISGQTGFDRGFDEFHIVTDFSDPHETDMVVLHGLDWIDQHHQDPFFLYLHVMNPHDPYEPPSPFDTVWWRAPMPEKFVQTLPWKPRDKFNFMTKILPAPGPLHATPEDVTYLRTMYNSDVTSTDWCVGMLARQLRDLGLLDDTLIVLIGDHGEEFFEHGAFGHGANIYNAQVHVPLILSNPRLFPHQRRIDTPVETISLFSTLAHLIGARRAPQLQGEDLLSKELKGWAYTEGKGISLLKLQTARWSLIVPETMTGFESTTW